MSRILLAAILAILLSPLHVRGATVLLGGPAGLVSVTHDGIQYLGNGQACSAVALVFRRGGSRILAPIGSGRFAVRNANNVLLTRVYEWGTLTCTYSVVADRLLTEVAITNTTGDAIDQIRIQLINLALQEGKITGVNGSDRNIGGPSVFIIPYPLARLYVANEQIARPLTIIPVRYPKALNLFLDSSVIRPPPLESPLARPIFPGRSDSYSLSLRFADPTEPVNLVMSDLFRRWSARFPSTENWPDRRPIGYLYLSGHAPETPLNPLNPRYWYFVNPKLDINSELGRQDFKRRLLAWADTSVANLERMNAQGMIVWDIEGGQYLQPNINYVGDPRYLPPEMQAVVDEFFRRFTRAGLRCGVTLRPQRLVVPGGGDWLKIKPYRINSQDPNVLFEQLDEKIQYTQHRFGCTLFYVDSNGTTGWPFDWSAFARLHAKHPDVLVVPEHKTLVYYSVTAPYCDVRLTSYDCPSAEARWLYPRAFSVINLSGGNAEMADVSTDLVDRVAAGDILMAPAWFADPHIKVVEDIERKALQMRTDTPQ